VASNDNTDPNVSRDQKTRLALPNDQIVEMVLKLTRQGEREYESRVRRYNHSYDVYRASERRPKSLESWQSQLRVPYGRQTIDTELVNIVSGFPRCLITPRTPDDEASAKAMQMVMDYEIAKDHLVEKQPVFVQQGLIFGTTIAKNHWKYETTQKTARDYTGLFPSIGTKTVILRDGPTFEPWNIYDAWWDSNARDVDSARYFVLRSWLDKQTLLDNECTTTGAHDRRECDGIYHNVDELLKVGPMTNGKAPTNTAQASFLGGQRERYKDLFEVLEIWTDDTVVCIGSRKVLLRNDPNPYWFGRKPIVLAQPAPDMFEMSGIAETELIDHLQNGMWTLQNMVVDNLHLTVMRGITYREGGVTDPNALQLKPRFKWPVVDHDDIRPFEVPQISSDVYEERQRMLSDMQLVTGINPYVSGSDLQSVDQNTATGITALQEVASRLLRFKASQIQYKGYQRSFEMWGDMIQQFMDKPTWVKIVGPNGNETWQQVTPQEVVGDYDYKLEGTEESLSRQQERGEAIAVLNAFVPLIQAGLINPKPILERVALAYGFPNPEALFPQQPPQQPPAAPGGVQQPPQGAPQQAQMQPQQLMQAMQNGNQPPPQGLPAGVAPPPGGSVPGQ
jgi:hypothetical protein